jgi:hypothetical protein
MKHLTLLQSLFFTWNVYAEVVYKTIPGTPFKDITEPVMIIDKGNIYPTLPGTNLRDYSATPQFVIE